MSDKFSMAMPFLSLVLLRHVKIPKVTGGCKFYTFIENILRISNILKILGATEGGILAPALARLPRSPFNKFILSFIWFPYFLFFFFHPTRYPV